MSKKYQLLNQPILAGGIYKNGMSLYRVESFNDDCLHTSVHLRRIKDGWELDAVGAALYLTDRGIELLWDYSKLESRSTLRCPAHGIVKFALISTLNTNLDQLNGMAQYH